MCDYLKCCTLCCGGWSPLATGDTDPCRCKAVNGTSRNFAVSGEDPYWALCRASIFNTFFNTLYVFENICRHFATKCCTICASCISEWENDDEHGCFSQHTYSNFECHLESFSAELNDHCALPLFYCGPAVSGEDCFIECGDVSRSNMEYSHNPALFNWSLLCSFEHIYTNNRIIL